jgi:hypothetical protein
MKYLKMLGLAAVAATALMAFLGASSASATVLCKTTATPCGASWHWPKGTAFDASLDPGTSALLTMTNGNPVVTCTESTVKGETENTGSASETVGITITELSFPQASCNNTVDVTEGHGTIEIHWIEGTHHGTVTAKGFGVTVVEFGLSCTYTAGATGIDLGTLTGGSMGTMDINAVVLKKEGSFLCPSTAIWNAKYTITSPEGAMYVVKE